MYSSRNNDVTGRRQLALVVVGTGMFTSLAIAAFETGSVVALVAFVAVLLLTVAQALLIGTARRP